MPFETENLPEAIRQVKKDLRRALPNYAVSIYCARRVTLARVRLSAKGRNSPPLGPPSAW
jgi:hypothetical protein